VNDRGKQGAQSKLDLEDWDGLIVSARGGLFPRSNLEFVARLIDSWEQLAKVEGDVDHVAQLRLHRDRVERLLAELDELQ
jgi:hypothetical protein